MLPTELVRWISLALFLAYVFGAVTTARGRPRERKPPDSRASRPLSLLTGPVWEVLILAAGVSLVLASIWPEWMYTGPLNVSFPGDSIAQILGLVAWLAGGALFSWSTRVLGKRTRIEILVTRDHQLETSGPYRWIRHPMYSAVLLLSGGLAVFLLNGGLGVLFLLTLTGAWRRALTEEDLLASEEAFGSEYQAYMRRTGRFLPRIGPAR